MFLIFYNNNKNESAIVKCALRSVRESEINWRTPTVAHATPKQTERLSEGEGRQHERVTQQESEVGERQQVYVEGERKQAYVEGERRQAYTEGERKQSERQLWGGPRAQQQQSKAKSGEESQSNS